MASFSLKTDALEADWEALEIQIQKLMTDNPKLAGIMDQVRKKKREGPCRTWDKTGMNRER